MAETVDLKSIQWQFESVCRYRPVAKEQVDRKFRRTGSTIGRPNVTQIWLMELCSFILSLLIVGATETRPGIMRVQYLEGNLVEEIYVYTEDYLSCWENGLPIQQLGPTDSGGTSTPLNSWLAFNMDDQERKRERIAQEIEDTYYAYHMYPHMAMVPDYFLRYWDLAEACCKYFKVPFYKPKLASEYKVK